nr:hypothetical protein BaRGS_001276 [Batillaria attramentaria]
MANKTINPFFFRPDHVSILSGEEEAVYAWLACQLSLGRSFQVYVGRRRFDLYAQSYLDFGQQLPHPADDVSKFQDDDVSRKVVGTGDPAECERVLTQVLDPVGGLCSPTPCSIRDRYQPAVGSMGFYGISAFLYAPNNLGAIEDDQTLNITKLRRNAWKHCNRSLEQFKAESDGKADFASNDCLLGLFIPLLLTRSLGIPEDSTAVKLAKQIEGERVDWALGAMLQELSMAFMDDLETSINCRPGNTPVTPLQ